MKIMNFFKKRDVKVIGMSFNEKLFPQKPELDVESFGIKSNFRMISHSDPNVMKLYGNLDP